MTYYSKYCILLSLALLPSLATTGHTEVLTSYDFDWALGGQENIMPATQVTGITASPFSRGPALGAYQASFTLDALGTQPGAILADSRFLAPYPIETAVEAGAYFEFTLEAGSDYLMTLESITLGSRKASAKTGPNFLAVRSSLDDFASDVLAGVSTTGGGGTASSSLVLEVGPDFENLSGSVTFRIYGYARNTTDSSYGIWAISNPNSNATVTTDDGVVSYGPEGSSPVLVQGSLFEIPEEGFLLTVGSTAGGSTDPAGPVAYSQVTEVEVAATPIAGYVFESWSGDVTSTDNPLSLTVNSDLNITGNFGPDTADDDADGLSNYDEIVVYETDPSDPDTSGDGLLDGEVVAIGSDPLNDYSAFVGIVQNRPAGFGLFAESEIQDVRFGGIIIEADSEGRTMIDFSVEESSDLSIWTEHENFTSSFTLPADRRFVRVRATDAASIPE